VDSNLRMAESKSDYFIAGKVFQRTGKLSLHCTLRLK
jgi:hypothetical protein